MTEYQYKLVNGELIELTPEEIAEHEELERNPPPTPQPGPDQGARANARIDAGIAAAQPAMDAASEAGADVIKSRTTEDQITAMQAQIDALQQAMSDMLIAQTGPTPREVN